ncbi:MAG TPA: VTT domain-containing protein [Vicinamibacteria bacterium]|nr:VTT domain-containing protein [Vicinamibacteria bacterium]
MELVEKLLWLLKPEGIQWLIQTGGLPAICLIVFAETGFFALLPGDSLLVLCGIFAATLGADGRPLLSLPALLTVVPLCGVAGDQVGYWIGTWFGKALYGWRDFSVLGIPIFKQAYLRKTEQFYEKWGTFFIVAGRWVPIVRTFAPIVAGIIRMPFRTFITYNVLGAFTWVWSMVLAGYFLPPLLQQVVPGFDLARNIDKIALVVVLLSVLPIAWTVHKERRDAAAAAASPAP